VIRVGVVLSILVVLAWIGLSVAAMESEDGLVLVAFFLPLCFVTALVVIWAAIGLFSAIRRYARAGRKLRADERLVKPS